MNSKYSNLTEDISTKFKQDSIIISELSGRIAMMYKNCSFAIDKEALLINENGDSVRLKDFNIDKYLFVIRFSEFNCLSCITKEMIYISSFLESNKNVICLATYSKLNDLNNSKRLMNMSFPVFNVPFGVFNNEMEQRKLPYYFIIDNNYRMRSLFIADPNNYKITDKYLKYITDLLGYDMYK